MHGQEVIARLKAMESPHDREGMARFGIATERALGIRVSELRKIARDIGRNHDLAAELWVSGIHEARILATMVDDPRLVTESQMEAWAADFNSWDLVDQCCGNLFDKTPHAYAKAVSWSARDETFVKRAAFSLMACLAVHDKQAPDADLAAFLPLIEREAEDGRNYVKKAVNWALRQIGKRNPNLNDLSIRTARAIARKPSRTARWVASDALRELQSDAVRRRL